MIDPVLHQRILSSASPATAKLTSYIAAFALLIFAVPPVLIGAAAASTGNNENVLCLFNCITKTVIFLFIQ